MSLPERSPERDDAILAMLPLVPEHGWSLTALKQALPSPEDASLLFPGGTADLIEAFSDLADRQTAQDEIHEHPRTFAGGRQGRLPERGRRGGDSPPFIKPFFEPRDRG